MVIGSSLSSLFVLFFYSEQSKNQIYLMNLYLSVITVGLLSLGR